MDWFHINSQDIKWIQEKTSELKKKDKKEKAVQMITKTSQNWQQLTGNEMFHFYYKCRFLYNMSIGDQLFKMYCYSKNIILIGV